MNNDHQSYTVILESSGLPPQQAQNMSSQSGQLWNDLVIPFVYPSLLEVVSLSNHDK
jgi:hypothetical protein